MTKAGPKQADGTRPTQVDGPPPLVRITKGFYGHFPAFKVAAEFRLALFDARCGTEEHPSNADYDHIRSTTLDCFTEALDKEIERLKAVEA